MLYACGLVYTLHASCNIPWGISLLSHCLLEQAGPSPLATRGRLQLQRFTARQKAKQKQTN